MLFNVQNIGNRYNWKLVSLLLPFSHNLATGGIGLWKVQMKPAGYDEGLFKSVNEARSMGGAFAAVLSLLKV